jgi:hypothetical protein
LQQHGGPLSPGQNKYSGFPFSPAFFSITTDMPKNNHRNAHFTAPRMKTIGGLRRPFLSWISEFRTRRISIAVNHLQPKLALNPETSKKE